MWECENFYIFAKVAFLSKQVLDSQSNQLPPFIEHLLCSKYIFILFDHYNNFMKYIQFYHPNLQMRKLRPKAVEYNFVQSENYEVVELRFIQSL